MNVLFVGDLHLGHRSILKHSAQNPPEGRRVGNTVAEHDEWVIQQCLSVNPRKKTLWYFMGDVAMEEERLELFNRLPGRKILVRGNHDIFKLSTYAKYFEDIRGGFSRYGFWITHIPMHPTELRGRPNVHGHVHDNLEGDDPMYLNTCIEWLPNKKPISLEQVREIFKQRNIPLGKKENIK